MRFDPHSLVEREFPPITQTYTERDTMLYALGLGLGSDPVDFDRLRYVYEDGLVPSPTFPFVLGYPGFWARDPDTGIDWKRLVNAEQSIRLHAPIPTAGTVIGRTQIVEIVDKGPAKGALLYLRRTVSDIDGTLLATIGQTTMLRGNGGQGGTTTSTPEPHRLPDRRPDWVHDVRTLPQSALLYRLSGDYNPLHADPKIATDAGFERPILHGLATFGMAAHAVSRCVLGEDVRKFTAMSGRFTAPVYPGETLRHDMWQDGSVVSVRTTVPDRGVVALDRGRIDIQQ
ncbi:MaoC/PaaZ C-terminal domain-containing protein [Rhodococcoides kyotonense]|uniref:MaoC/PaaZ C-terminal domain-containing protein n=1 Tax=Rhodococcoides kyotonense TaxID=398843 RepID=UPI001C3E0A90|nr:MaoC/PaaZ C-terminal domain-containing protein [Rhodococcus kyotonensis]